MAQRGSKEEKNRLLDELQNFGVPEGASAVSSALQESVAILHNAPQWAELEHSGFLPPGSASHMKNFHLKSDDERRRAIIGDPETVKILFRLLKSTSESQNIRFALCVFYEAAKDDSHCYDSILKFLSNQDVSARMLKILDRPQVDVFCADKSAFLLSSFVCRDPSRFETSHKQHLSRQIARPSAPLSVLGRLEVAVNLLKNDENRKSIIDSKSTSEFVLSNFSPKEPQNLYLACFCVWLLSLNRTITSKIISEGLFQKLCRALKGCKVEKVVRVSIKAIQNMIHSDDSLEIILDENLLHILTLLEYEKWRDEDLYSDIRDILAALHRRIHQYSNFDRYSRELDGGKLKWSQLHSETFWHENFLNFEQNEFEAVKKLSLLLHSKDPLTLTVACHDLGEFSRWHPTGKKLLHKLKVKERIMGLMSSKNKEVRREALLAAQKLMLNSWREVATAA